MSEKQKKGGREVRAVKATTTVTIRVRWWQRGHYDKKRRRKKKRRKTKLGYLPLDNY